MNLFKYLVITSLAFFTLEHLALASHQEKDIYEEEVPLPPRKESMYSKLIGPESESKPFNPAVTSKDNTSHTSSFFPSEEKAQPERRVDTHINTKISPDGRSQIIFEESQLIPGEDRRKRVNSTIKKPYPMHGHMMIEFGGPQSRYTATGTLIGPSHVLTAGHNVYSHAKGEGWATKVSFFPARNEVVCPFDEARGVRLLSVEGWVRNKDPNYDMAMVILDRAIGKKTGWCGLLCSTNEELAHLSPIHVTGYPGEKGEPGKKSTQMWTMEGKRIIDIKDERFFYDIDTSPGQSGGGVWAYKDGSYYTVGIHTHGKKKGSYGNSATRISPPKFNQIIKWMKGQYEEKASGHIKVKRWHPGVLITYQGLEELAAQGIRGLDISGHQISNDELKDLFNDNNLLFLRAVGSWKDLRLVSSALTLSSSNLRVLDLSNSELAGEKVHYIFSNLPEPFKLQKLNLSGNQMIHSADLSLLSNRHTLTDINVSRTSIGNTGVQYLLTNKHLKRLNLASTNIHDEGVHRLINAIRNNKSPITHLILTKNKNLSNAVKKELKELAKEKLDLKIEF